MIRGLTQNTILLYNLVLLVGFVWFCIRYRGKELPLFIIILFFGGMFSDLGGKSVFEAYKILTLLWAMSLVVRKKSFWLIKQYSTLILSFSVFCLYFIGTSLYINGDNFTLVFAQLSKYIIPFLLLFVMMYYARSRKYSKILNKLFEHLIIAQIIFTIAKLFIIQHPYEGLVGSITGVTGGGLGTTFPLLGLLWIALNTNMNLKRKDIWMIIGLLFIGFMTGKRAIWLLFPIFFLLLSIYVYRRNFGKKLIYVIVLFPAFVYLGLRLSPTLNPDNKIWGEFDMDYAWNYSVKYSTGKKSNEDNIENGIGRIGALTLVTDQLTNVDYFTKETLFGYGLKYIYAADLDNYMDSQYYFGINSRGSLTGVIMEYFAIGIFGVILHMIFLILIFHPIKNHRLRFVMCFLVLFDYIFYNSMIIREPGMMVLMFYLIIYSNRIFIPVGVVDRKFIIMMKNQIGIRPK